MSVEKYDIKSVTLKLAAIESVFDVNSISFRGMRVWPLVRLMLYEQLFWAGEDYLPQDVAVFKVPIYNKKFPELPAGVSRTEVFWYCNPQYSTDKIEGRFYSRFEDPFLEMFRQYKVRKFELYSETSEQKQPRLHEPIYLKPTVEHVAVPADRVPSIPGFDDLAHVVKGICGVKLSSQQLFQRASIIFAYSGYFKDLLMLVKPKSVYLVCYYSNISMALVRACHMLGIPTVEYQHGKQGKYHCMYTHWTAVPEDGYELMPRFFWNWGKESANNISASLPSGNSCHRPLVGGSLWLGLWVRGMWPEDQETVSRLEEELRGRESVLVTLQPLGKLLPESIMQAMKYSPNLIWLLRLPPAYRHRMSEVVEDLEAWGIENYDLDLANGASLYSLLKRVEHHVTGYSSVCYEALSFGINSILTNPVAMDMYPDYISQGLFRYETDGQGIIDAIEFLSNSDFIAEEHPYIVTDFKAATKTAGFILTRMEQEKKIHG